MDVKRGNHPNKRAFLKAYSDTCSITKAAKAIGCSRQLHYHWIAKDPRYRDAFHETEYVVADTLEGEAARRATEGVRRQKFYRGRPLMLPCKEGEPEAVKQKGGGYARPYYEYKYSDTLMMFLLKAAMPEKYRGNYQPRAGNREIIDAIIREAEALAGHQTAAATGDNTAATKGGPTGRRP